MKETEILITPNLEDDGIIFTPQFIQPLDSEIKYPIQYQYISVFTDLLLKKTDTSPNKIGFVCDVPMMKHFLSFILYSYDSFIIKKIIESDDSEEDNISK